MSLRGDKYETKEEVEFRLNGTIVLYDNEPVYISQVTVADPEVDEDKISRVYFNTLPLHPNKKPVRKYLSSRKFDLAPFKMGYMNHTINGIPDSVFLSRKPIRQNKQGLSETTLFIEYLGKPDPNHEKLNFRSVIRNQGFVDMVHGKYPSFKEAGEMIAEVRGHCAVALSRKFVVRLDPDLELLILCSNKSHVGFAVSGDSKIRLANKFHFLREELGDMGIPVE